MDTLKVDVKNVLGTVTSEQIQALDPEATQGLEKLHKGTGLGSDFLGWVNLPTTPPMPLWPTSRSAPPVCAATAT